MKGVGILLVVVGHSGCPQFLHDLIYAFHMPLFFLISGYLFKETYFDKKITYVLRKIKSLYIPFVFWNIFFILLHNLFVSMHLLNDTFGYRGKVYYSYPFHEMMCRIFKGFALMNSESFSGAFWFIKALFLGSILYLLVQSKMKNRWVLPFACLGIIIARLALVSVNILPASGETLHQVLFSVFFISIGAVLKKKNLLLKKKYLALGLVFFVVLSQLRSLSMGQNLLNCIFIPVTGILGYIILFNICKKKWSEKSSFAQLLSKFGDNSLYILIFHFLMFKPISLLKVYLFNLPLLQIGEFPVIEAYNTFFWILYTVFSVVTAFLIGCVVLKVKQCCLLLLCRKKT